MTNSPLLSEKVRLFLIESAARYPEIERIILFGSRARGDARPRSDFDLAAVAPTVSRPRWSRFTLDLLDNIPTLCSVDLLLLNDKQHLSLQAKIKDEGVVIYDRAA